MFILAMFIFLRNIIFLEEKTMLEKNDFHGKKFTYLKDDILVNSEKIIKPKTLCKFFSINQYNLKALSGNYLYASHPFELNDLMDSSGKILSFDDFDLDEKRKIYLSFFENEDSDKIKKEYLKKAENSNFKILDEMYFDNHSRSIGNISFVRSEENTDKGFNNILMWSHYSGHNGFCVEFDGDILLDYRSLNKEVKGVFFRPMQYVEEIEVLNLKKEIDFENDKIIPFLYATTIKKNDWAYENEFRLTVFKEEMSVPLSKRFSMYKDIKGANDRYYNYNEKAIKRIFIGRYFLNSEFIKLEKNKDLLFYNLIKSNDLVYRTYNDEFERIKVKNEYEIFKQFMSILFEKYSEKIYMMEEAVEDGKLKIKPHKLKLMKIEGEDRYQFIDESRKE